MRVRIRLLGGFAVSVDDRVVPDGAWPRRQATSLVKLLALQPGHRLPRERVVDALWPDLLLEDAAPRLHKAAHYARTALGSREAVVLHADTVALLPDADVLVDVEAFDAAAEAVRRGVGAAEDALALYHADLLPDDLYEPWTEDPRDTRRLRYLELLRECGRWEALVAADPLDDEAHLRLVEDYVRRGDRQGALRQLDRAEAVLRRELGEVPEAFSTLREEVEAVQVEPVGVTSRATPVPVPATVTIGRAADIESVLSMLERSRAVTLLGPGGVGKTRLAGEVALRHAVGTATETCFVDLTQVSDPALVPELVARELGIEVRSAGHPERVLAEALRGRSMLLLLDNFEHVVAAASIVSRLLAVSDGVRVLATSRTRLRVAGEQVYDVAPLSVEDTTETLPDAVALFGQAAVAVDAGFDLDRYLDDVRAVCESVDGLPLAIELAAGHVRTLIPPLLRARLGARLRSATGSTRDGPSRHQTIPATIDWSLQLLGPAERRLFARLGVFATAVPLEAVEQVCGDDGPDGVDANVGDLVDVLSRLVDHSLVRRRPGPGGAFRFGLLELLRERARELLTEEDDGPRLAARHAAYVCRVLDDLQDRPWTDAAGSWVDVIDELLPEIRAAHAWALQHGEREAAARITAGLGAFWHRQGHHAEGRRWVAAAVADLDELDDHLAARVLLSAGFVEWPQDQDGARVLWTGAVERFRALGDDRLLAYALIFASYTHVGDDDAFATAIACCDEAVEVASRVGESPLLVDAFMARAAMGRLRGDHAAAMVDYEQSRRFALESGDRTRLSILLFNLSFMARHRGDFEEARALGCEALRICWSLGRRMLAAWIVSVLAGPELGLGRAERGARLVGAADAALQALGVERHAMDLQEHHEVVAALRSALGESYERIHAEGSGLSLDEAVTLALTDPSPGAATAERQVRPGTARAPDPSRS